MPPRHAPTRSSWPGRDIGVRAPDPGETPLSEAEVDFGAMHDLIEPVPTVHRHRPIGTWERKRTPGLAVPTPWDALL
jgi:hypothetical protein